MNNIKIKPKLLVYSIAKNKRKLREERGLEKCLL